MVHRQRIFSIIDMNPQKFLNYCKRGKYTRKRRLELGLFQGEVAAMKLWGPT